MTTEKQSGGVTIGNVTGGINNSVFAGRDVKNATITLGGQSVPVDKEPTINELKQLVAEIQQELTEVMAQQEALQAISPAIFHSAQGAEDNIKEAAAKIEHNTMEGETAKSVQNYLNEASELLLLVLNKTKAIAQKAGEVANSVKPLAEKLEPVVEKIGVAALWLAKLYF